MVISENSQLGLRFKRKETKVEFMTFRRDVLLGKIDVNKAAAEKAKAAMEKLEEAIRNKSEDGSLLLDDSEGVYGEYLSREDLTVSQGSFDVERRVDKLIPEGFTENIVIKDDGKYFFICDSVYKAAELIKIGENFTGRTLKDIDFGQHTYLIGRNRMVRFVCGLGFIKGFFYNDKERVCFDFGIEMETGEYYYDEGYQDDFSMVMRVLTFVELGDIEVKMLESGRNNGGRKNVDKVTNTSEKTVYVVDSSWNQIIIRTTGFAVRGHFRLQACGEGLKDRKLIWISAFEKHGYKRRPTGEIAH